MNTDRVNDRGLSFVELIVVVVLLGILAAVVGVIFANSWRAQQDVTTTSEATNAGQLVGQSLERAVRNGAAIDPDTAGGTTLRVRTLYTDGRQCQVFWVSAGKLYMASARTAALMPSPNEWANNVQPAAQYFAVPDAFTATYAFKLGTATASVAFGGTVSLRTTNPGDGGACWS